MNKTRTLLIIALILTGCASTSSELETKESLLIASGDKKQLIEFYKANLGIDDSYNVKLVETYLDMKDIKSAQLYAKTFSEKDRKQSNHIYVAVRIAYQKQQYKVAESKLENYLSSGGDKYLYHLMKGKIKAQQAQFDDAINLFEQSRKLTINDREVLNNIAVVNMMQKNYTDAMQILYDLYLQDKNDPKIRANLIVASVHAERPDIALDALKEKYSEEQAHEQLNILMKSVQRSEPNNSTQTLETKTVKTPKPVPQSNKKNGPDKTDRQEETKMAVTATDKKPPEFIQLNSPTLTEMIPSEPIKTDPIDTARISQDHKVNVIANQSKLKSSPHKFKRKTKPSINSIYRIQVLATYKAISNEYLRYLKENYGPVYAYTNKLWKRYCIGEFNTIEEAKLFLAQMQIKGAFVVDYTKNRHIKL